MASVMVKALGQEGKQSTETIALQNAQAPLLRIPQEIKEQIYVLVCGGNLLHITIVPGLNQNIKFRHSKCLSTKTEEEAQKSFDASTSPWFDEVSVNRHCQCAPRFLGVVSGPISQRPTLDLRFLRTCRQIYDEAKSFCYTANTFSFDNWVVLWHFVNMVNWTSNLRSIRLLARSGTNGREPPNWKMLQDVSKKLTGLQTFMFNWEQFPCYDSRKYNQQAEEATQFTRQLLCFAGAALKSVVVVISDAPETTQFFQDDDESQQLNRWTIKQKQEYSQFLRHAMIQHRGNDKDVKKETGKLRVPEVCWDELVVR